MYRMKESLVKKFNEVDRPSPLACAAALKKFNEVNARLGSWTFNPCYSWEEELYGLFKHELYRFWYTDPSCTEPLVSNWGEIFSSGRLGPGANLLANGTDLYTKLFSSPLTATKALPDVWALCCATHPQFRDAYSNHAWVDAIKVVESNKISFVNKTRDIARLIAVEPTLNTWFQLGFGHHLESRLRAHFGIDLALQPDINRRLATIGSIHDRLSTIDLESASDSMSITMLQNALPKSFFDWLMRLRSPSSRLPDGSVVVNNMVSTMGNGFTFPLQTIVFTCAVVACYRYAGIPYVIRRDSLDSDHVPHGLIDSFDSRNLAVFGDDIICDKRVTHLVIKLLALLGFKVNSDKSFVEGPFRESCGVDSFLGVDVRPVYIKSLRTLQEAFATINRLNVWSARHNVSLRNVVQLILKRFPKALRYPVPLDEDDSAGLHLPWSITESLGKRRRGRFGSFPYTKFRPAFYGYRIDVEKECFQGAARFHVYNPTGLYMCFLAGSIRGYRISVRQTPVRYITKRTLTPNWDYVTPQKLIGKTQSISIRRLVDACGRNL
jgi:hypothetical protein